MFTMNGINYVTEHETDENGIKLIRKIPRKYDLIYDRIESMRRGRKLYRIRARRDFQSSTGITVHKGDFGGLIEHRWNLSHEGSCWIHYDSCVYGQVEVIDSACVTGNSVICSSHASYIGKETCIVDSSISAIGNIYIYADKGTLSRPTMAGSHICVKDDRMDIFGNITIDHSIIISSVKCNIYGCDRFNIDKSKIYLYNTDESKIFSGVVISDSIFDPFKSRDRKGIVVTNSQGIDTKILTTYTDGTVKVCKKVFNLTKEKNTFEIR